MRPKSTIRVEVRDLLNHLILIILAIIFMPSCKEMFLKINDSSKVNSTLSLENRSDGKGNELGGRYNVLVGETLDIYAVERASSGKYLGVLDVNWTLNGGIGKLTILSSGKRAQFSSSVAGKAEIKVNYQGLTQVLILVVEEPSSYSWDFKESTKYIFNPDIVEFFSGSAWLKKVKSHFSGTDFENGTHVGTYVNDDGYLSINSKGTNELRIDEILDSVTDSDVVAYWRLNANWTDASENNHSLIGGGTGFSTEAIQGSHSASFDNSSFVEFEDHDDFDKNLKSGFTISFWYRLNGLGEQDRILSKACHDGSDWTNSTFMFTKQSSDYFTFWLFDTESTKANVRTMGLLEDLTWYHVVSTYDGSEVSIYLDGVLQESENIVDVYDSTIDLMVGSRRTGAGCANIASQNATGDLDELVILKKPLSAKEVYKLYVGQGSQFTELSPTWSPKWDNIVGYWKMDGNWQDSSGSGHHGTPVGDSTFTQYSKVGTRAGVFDGDGDYVNIPATPTTTISSETISAWIRSDGDSATPGGPISPFGINPTANSWHQLSILSSSVSQNNIRCGIGDLDSGGGDTPIRPIPKGVWLYIVCVQEYTAGTINLSLYIDGELSATLSKVAANYNNARGNYNIARQKTASTRDWSGSVDDAAHWNIALSSEDIVKIYNRQKQKYSGHYESPIVDLGASSTWTNLKAITSLPFGKELVVQGGESSSAYSSLIGDLSEGLVGYWPLNETRPDSVSGSDFEDKTEYSNHGVETGVVGFGRPGVISKSASFDGIDDFIQIPSTLSDNLNDKITISAWANLTDDGETTYEAIFTDVFSGDGNVEFSLAPNISGSNPNEMCAGFFDTHWNVVCLGESMKPGKWRFYAATYDGDKIRIFSDGELKNTSISFAKSLPSGTTGWRIGRRWDNGTYWNGKISEVSIWNRDLSPIEIKQLYRRGANRIKYQVKSCVDPSCQCKSLSVLPEGSSTDCDGDGILNANDDNDIYLAEFIGPGGGGGTFYSELFNRSAAKMTFSCGDNISDVNSDICVDDEIELSESSLAAGPNFDFLNYAPSASVGDNRYFQYRVILESEDNTACSGLSCMPALTSIEIGPEDRYYGGSPVIKSKNPIEYHEISQISFSEGGACDLTYQLSSDGSTYFYWDGAGWSTVGAEEVSESSSGSDISSNISKFSAAAGSGSLHFKAFMTSDTTQSCELNKIELKMSK